MSSEHGERKDGYYRYERARGSFARSLTLPGGVDPEAIEASFDKGSSPQGAEAPAAAGGGASA